MHPAVFLVFVFAVGLEGLRVHGPSGPVVAELGGSALLSCLTENPLPLEDLQVEWRKTESDSLVIIFQQGESRPDLQSQEFRGRVDFFPDELSKGNFSISLRHVLKEDTGGYRCKINATKAKTSTEAVMEIKVMERLGLKGADGPVFAYEGQQAILTCFVESHVPANQIEEITWKKTDPDQDILVLLYQNNEAFPDSSDEHYQGRVELFASEIPKGNFSLKLTNVRMEDKGEFVCEVHTSDTSARTIVLLQGVGFSARHILILLLCFVALLLALGFCLPVLYQLRKKVTLRQSMMIHIPLIVCPNICMFVAFCLWSKEVRISFHDLVNGGRSEVIACSVVSIMRPVMLMKTSPYLDRLPPFLQKTVKNLAVPLYQCTVTLGACTYFFENVLHTPSGHVRIILMVVLLLYVIVPLIIAFYGLRMHLTVNLEILNICLLGVFLVNNRTFTDDDVEVISVLAAHVAGMRMILALQRHLFQGKPFKCVHIAVISVAVATISIAGIAAFIDLSIRINSYTRLWIIPFEVFWLLIVWLVVFFLLRCQQGYRQRCCAHWRKIGFLCCVAIVTIIIIMYGGMSLHYINTIMKAKDRAGHLALAALVHVLSATCLFKHPKHLPAFLHVMIYMIGAVGLSTANAAVLATEHILKAGKGTRTIQDLSTIVLSLETVFALAWLALQIYDAWVRTRDRVKHNFEDAAGTGPEVVPEMQALSVQSSRHVRDNKATDDPD